MMNWLNDLIKQITFSKTVAISMFISTLLMLGAKRLFGMDVFENVVASLVIWVCFFSGALIFVWVVAWGINNVRNITSKSRKVYLAKKLSKVEVDFLIALGNSESGYLLISNLDLRALKMSKIELMGLFSDMERKGLVDLSIQNPNYVSITPYGQKVALDYFKPQNRI